MYQPIRYNKYNFSCHPFPYDKIERYSGEIFLRIAECLPYSNFNPYLFISNYGRVYNTEKDHFTNITSFYKDGDLNKYAMIRNMNGEAFLLHRVVLSCFVEDHLCETKDLFVDHINEIKNDNRVNMLNSNKNNLEWVTPGENAHRAQHGEGNNQNKVSEKTVLKIAELLMDGKGDIEIATMLKDLNVTVPIVANIRNKRNWEYLTEEFDFPKMKPQKIFTENEVHMICKYFEETKEKYFGVMKLSVCEQTLRHFGYPVDPSHMNAIKLILRRVMYKSIVKQYNY